MGEAAIAQRCGHCAAIQHQAAHLVVNRLRGYAGDDEGGQFIKDFRRQPPGAAHPFEPFGPVQLDGAIPIDGHVGGYVLIFDHATGCSAYAPELREGAKALRYSSLTVAITPLSTGRVNS